MTDTGSDARRHDFFIIDNEVVDNYKLGPYAGWLYVVIVRHVNQKSNEAFPSLSTLAKETGMSEPSVIKYLAVLEQQGLIRIEKHKHENGVHDKNHYVALAVPKQVVKEVNQGGNSDLPGVVKEVESNNTNKNKTVLANAKKPRGKRQSSKPSFPAEQIDPVKDRIVELFGWNWEAMTPQEKGYVQTAAYSWLSANGTIAELQSAYDYCLTHFDYFKPTALPAHKSDALKTGKLIVAELPTPSPTDDVWGDPLGNVTAKKAVAA